MPMEEDVFSTVSSSNPKWNNETLAETSGLSNFLLRPCKRSCHGPSIFITNAVASRYKGVVQQRNGRWGAQIYANHNRVWLGTFRSEEEAAMAYDSASIKLRNAKESSHRNFPWTDCTIQEVRFQENYQTETILAMIQDGSYQPKLQEYLRFVTKSIKDDQGDCKSQEPFSCSQLFQKELTPSDVGKLNRLVIPKKYAVKYLPYISENQNENSDMEDVELVMYDKLMKQWKFRYCYWRSSQSFVITRGWNSYVKENSLKEKDTVTFYSCEVRNQGKRFLMIDVSHFDRNLDLGLNLGQVSRFKGDGSNNELELQELRQETGHHMKKNKGFMLFGVRID